jgi:predicted outer membrane protein
MTRRQSFVSFVTASTTGLVLATAAHAQTATTGGAQQLHEADQTFITDGTKAVSTQLDAARLADSRSTDRDVKAFAEKVVSDDTTLANALRAASPRGVDVPRNDPDNTVLDSIKNLRGADFDKAYIQQVALAGQQKAISAFQAEIASGREAQLKSAASKGLPTLQADYAQAQQLAQRKHLVQ